MPKEVLTLEEMIAIGNSVPVWRINHQISYWDRYDGHNIGSGYEGEVKSFKVQVVSYEGLISDVGTAWDYPYGECYNIILSKKGVKVKHLYINPTSNEAENVRTLYRKAERLSQSQESLESSKLIEEAKRIIKNSGK